MNSTRELALSIEVTSSGAPLNSYDFEGTADHLGVHNKKITLPIDSQSPGFEDAGVLGTDINLDFLP